MSEATFAKRPLIGLVSSRSGDNKTIHQRYMNAVWHVGGLPVVLPYTTDAQTLSEYAEIFDGFLFSGGVDVNPAKYGETVESDLVEIDEIRDEFEEVLFKAIYPTGKPILGICRGIQSINVWLGGTLYQDMDGHRQDVAAHLRVHPIEIYEGSMLHRICGKTSVMVNTFHHQAVKNLAPALTADAVSPDGFIEAAHEEGHRFLFATQFHPECYWHVEDDDHSVAIFRAFLDACRS